MGDLYWLASTPVALADLPLKDDKYPDGKGKVGSLILETKVL